MTFGSQVDATAAQSIVDHLLDRGLNFLDTANVYNQGESERILGRCLAGRRDRVILASKAFGRMVEAGYEGLSRAAILRAVDDSLSRLQTDYLDLLYLHRPDANVPLDESLEAVESLVKAGKVRFPALSNYAAWQVTQAQWIASSRGFTPATVTQPLYNLLARGLDAEFLPMCAELGIFTSIYNPLAGGLLTGKQPKDGPVAGSRFDGNQMYLDRYWHPDFFDAVDTLSAAAKIHERSLLSVALSWLYHHTPVDCLILGASRLEQLKENLSVLGDGPLPESMLATCDTVWAKLRGVTPKYNR